MRKVRLGGWLIWSVLLVQFALVSVSFPLSQLASAEPLFYIDSSFHWFEIEVAKVLARQGQVVGYDPYFAAGFVDGVGFNVSAKVPALLAVLFPWLSTIVAYKAYVFVAAVLAPACVPLAARWLGLSVKVASVAAIFGVLLWWLTALRWYHTAGLVSFVLAAYVALPYSALVVRYAVGLARSGAVALLVAVGAAGFFLHPLFPVLAAPLILALTAASWREINPRRVVIGYPILAGLCLLPNLVWILPTLRHPGFAVGNVQPYQRAVDISIVWNEALGRITQDARGSRLNLVVWFAALLLMPIRLEARGKRAAIAIMLASAFLIVFSAIGAALPFVGTLQPNRFSSVAYLFLCVPASIGIVGAFERLSVSRGFAKVALLGSMSLFAAAAVFSIRELARELSYADVAHHGERPPEVKGIGPMSAWLLDWLTRHTAPDARVLFEISAGRIHDEAHMAGFLALTANREFIGGPYPYTNFASFGDGRFCGRPIGSFAREDFISQLDLYNIGWIVAFSDSAKRYLSGIPAVLPKERFGPLQTYQVTLPHTYFAKGAGTVANRTVDGIELDELSGRDVILKYHYVAGLASVPTARVEPVSLPGDPEPFIRIVDPPPHLLLRMP